MRISKVFMIIVFVTQLAACGQSDGSSKPEQTLTVGMTQPEEHDKHKQETIIGEIEQISEAYERVKKSLQVIGFGKFLRECGCLPVFCYATTKRFLENE